MIDSETIYSRLPFLRNAVRFFVFARIWWEGCGFDSIVVWEDEGKVGRKVLLTGETTTFTEALVIREDDIEVAEFETFLTTLARIGWMDVPSQLRRIHLTHYDNAFGIKSSPGSDPHWMFVAGGKHADPRATNLLAEVERYCPEVA